MEPGLEALLRSAGGSLLHLSVSQCPNVLTERTLWLASCYCRNLETLTYRSVSHRLHDLLELFRSESAFPTVCVLRRSSSHPPTQEVLWALGAGCRNISTLQVAPSHPWSAPAPSRIVPGDLIDRGLLRKFPDSSFSLYNLQPANRSVRGSLPADDRSMLATAALAQCWRSRMWDSGTARTR